MDLSRDIDPDQPIALPRDTEILFFDPDQQLPPATGCNSCAPRRTEGPASPETMFLATSPGTASYIVLDRDLLPGLRALLAGETPRTTLAQMRTQHGYGPGLENFQTLLRNIVGRNFLADAEREEFEPARAHMQLYVTNRCNLRCTHCYMSSGEALPQGEMDAAGRRKAVELFARHYPGGKITLTGGEALLSPDIFSLMQLARERGLRVEIFSNGLTIKDRDTAERIADHADEAQVSIDGATAAVNDAIRGRGTFEKIIRGIHLLDEAATTRKGFRLRIAMTLTSTNVDDIHGNIDRFVAGLALRTNPEIRVGTVGPLGRARDDPALIADPEALQNMQADIVNSFSRRGMHRIPLSAVNRFTKTCGMGLSITIAADGAIYPCTITRQRALGNIADPSAEAVIRSVKSYFHDTKVDAVEGCRSCNIRYFCGGICRITNQYRMGSMQRSACTPAYKNNQVRNLIARYESFGLS